MKYWLLADTHFGHHNIKKYCDRPDDFEELILQNVKNTVKETDTLIHLGDIAFGATKDQLAWQKKLFDCLPEKCNKWLIIGNHDKKSVHWYLYNGWNFAGYSIKMKMYGKQIMFTHGTQPKSLSCENEKVDYIIHGHCHNHFGVTKTGWKEHEKGKILIMMEHNYMPIDLQGVIS